MKQTDKIALVVAVILATPLTAFALTNPLGDVSIPIIIGNIIRFLLGLTGAIALFMFVWGGLLWITSAGNDTRVKKGRDTLVWAVLGLVVIFSAYTIVATIVSSLSDATEAPASEAVMIDLRSFTG